MKREWTTIEVLRHARHDWLNKLQLIKGNLALNKIDRVKEIIDEVVFEARQETILSNLNIPQFASLLLTYNWENNLLSLEYEILEPAKIRPGELQDEQLAEWTMELLGLLNRSVDEYAENSLSVSVEPENEGIRFFFDFRGIIKRIDDVNQFFSRSASFQKKILHSANDEFTLEVFLPYLS